MANTWFRLYSEFSSDPKVQMLSESNQRRLVMLFCLRCDETLETLHETEIAFHLRISEEELESTKALFVQKGFIDDDWCVLNWNDRQFISDSSTERVRRSRQRKKQDETLHEPIETLHETHVTIDVTAPEQIQSRTDTEQNRAEQTLALTSNEVPAEAGVFELPLPGKQGEWQVPKNLYDELVAIYPDVSVMAELGKMRAWLLTNPRKTAKGLPRFIANWLTRTQDSPRKKSTHNGGTNGSTGKHTNGNSSRGTDGNEEALREVLAEQRRARRGSGGVPAPAGGDVRPQDEQEVRERVSGDVRGHEPGGVPDGVYEGARRGEVLPTTFAPKRAQWPGAGGGSAGA